MAVGSTSSTIQATDQPRIVVDGGADTDDPDQTGAHWAAGRPALHWPEWSPLLTRADPAVGERVVNVEIDRVVWAWRCDSCGAASSDAGDFQRIAGDATHRSCTCGGDAERTPAVYCDSCDTLILLRSADPDLSE